jgi:hypothetical protein
MGSNNEESNENENKFLEIQLQFYQIMRNIILFFIGFGSPLNVCLKTTDNYMILLDIYRKIWMIFRLFSWLIIKDTKLR